mmetsp:Transcript_93460/g.166300  ORF Transcript_93460/g.166300 Transcript_93460/m.166300 type:complete len:155 (+) Transcript_93460:44-508(+)
MTAVAEAMVEHRAFRERRRKVFRGQAVPNERKLLRWMLALISVVAMPGCIAQLEDFCALEGKRQRTASSVQLLPAAARRARGPAEPAEDPVGTELQWAVETTPEEQESAKRWSGSSVGLLRILGLAAVGIAAIFILILAAGGGYAPEWFKAFLE